MMIPQPDQYTTRSVEEES